MAPSGSKSSTAIADPADALARNLVAARTAAGLTQQALAERSGVSRATIALIEAGRSDPRRSTVGLLAAALGVSPIVLFVESSDVAALAADPTAEASSARFIGESIARSLGAHTTGVAALAAFAAATAAAPDPRRC